MVYQRAFIAKPHNTQKLSSLSIFGTKHELNQRSPTFLARQTQSHALVPAVILQPCVTETNKQWGLLCLRTQPIDHNTAPHISWKRETDKLMRRERTVEPIYFLVCVCVCVDCMETAMSSEISTETSATSQPSLLMLPSVCGQTFSHTYHIRGRMCSIGGEQI